MHLVRMRRHDNKYVENSSKLLGKCDPPRLTRNWWQAVIWYGQSRVASIGIAYRQAQLGRQAAGQT